MDPAGRAIVCGLTFSVLKIIDYREKFQHRITPETNTFYTLYFVLTWTTSGG